MAQPTKQAQEIRRAIETISIEMAVIEMRVPRLRLRVRQELEWTGHAELLCPALSDADEISKSLKEMRMQISAALAAIGGARIHS